MKNLSILCFALITVNAHALFLDCFFKNSQNESVTYSIRGQLDSELEIKSENMDTGDGRDHVHIISRPNNKLMSPPNQSETTLKLDIENELYINMQGNEHCAQDQYGCEYNGAFIVRKRNPLFFGSQVDGSNQNATCIGEL